MIGRSLRVLRNFHQLKQTDLAKKLKISNSYLSEIESESKVPSIDLLNQYAVVFKLPVSSILLFSEKMKSTKPSEKIRVIAADKILSMLEWISHKNSIDFEAEENIPS